MRSNSSALVRKELYAKYYASGDGMHEDFAIWLSILKEGKRTYGVDEPLLIYRIAKSSKSGNKVKAAKMNWNTYRYAGLKPIEAAYYEGWYMIKNVIKYTNLKISGWVGITQSNPAREIYIVNFSAPALYGCKRWREA